MHNMHTTARGVCILYDWSRISVVHQSLPPSLFHVSDGPARSDLKS